jgi:hypothetical protein
LLACSMLSFEVSVNFDANAELCRQSPASQGGGPSSRSSHSMWDFGGQSGTGKGLYPSSLGLLLPVSFHWTLHNHMLPGGRTIDQLVAAVQRQSHPIDTKNNYSINDTSQIVIL